MIIPVDDDNRIVSDEMCWTIQERVVTKAGKNPGAESWVNRAYYTNIETAIKQLGNRMVRKSEATNIIDAMNDIALISEKISKAFEPSK